MKRICKKGGIYVLVSVLVSSAVFFSYRKADTVKAVAVVDDAIIITTVLAAFGLLTGYYLQDRPDFDGTGALDDFESHYEQERLTLIQGGAGNDDDGDGDFDEDDVPTWKQFKNKILSNTNTPIMQLAPNIVKCLVPVVYELMNGSSDGTEDVEPAFQKSKMEEFCSVSYPYYLHYFFYHRPTKTWFEQYVLLGPLSVVGFNPSYNCYSGLTASSSIVYEYDMKEKTYIRIEYPITDPLTQTTSFSCDAVETTNLRIFDSFADAKSHLQDIGKGGSNDEVIWTTPELRDTFKNEGNLERLPNLDANVGYNLVNQLALQQLLQQLQGQGLSAEEKENLMNAFVNKLKTDVKPNPDLDPNPDPDVKPDPNPDTDPDNPNPDKPDGEVGEKPFLADLKELFPFCIPFDLIHAIKVLDAKGEPPRWVIPIHFSAVGLDKELVIDFSDADNVVSVIRIFETLGFIVALICATRALIKG